MIDIETARHYYRENDSAHGFEHVLRVWRLAQRIGSLEGADMDILQAATLLHDVGRPEEARTGRSHAEIGAEWARRILAGHPPEKVEAVARAILQHRFRGAEVPDTVEARVLHDADKLDAIGAIGIARAYAVAGQYRQRLWAEVGAEYAERPPAEGQNDLTSLEHTPVHEYLFKLRKLASQMYTETGRRLAEERSAYMAGFFERLTREVTGEI